MSAAWRERQLIRQQQAVLKVWLMTGLGLLQPKMGSLKRQPLPTQKRPALQAERNLRLDGAEATEDLLFRTPLSFGFEGLEGVDWPGQLPRKHSRLCRFPVRAASGLCEAPSREPFSFRA